MVHQAFGPAEDEGELHGAGTGGGVLKEDEKDAKGNERHKCRYPARDGVKVEDQLRFCDQAEVHSFL